MSQLKSLLNQRHMLNKRLLDGRHLCYQWVRNFKNSSNYQTKEKTASAVYRTMNIFDRKAKTLQKERSAQREDYHLFEYIKEEIGWRTADRIFDIKRTFHNAVELVNFVAENEIDLIGRDTQSFTPVISLWSSEVYTTKILRREQGAIH